MQPTPQPLLTYPPLPTPSPACLLFITFILISLKLSHKLKFVLSLFSPPLLCLAHKWQTKIFYVHPKLSKYCSPPAILVLLCLSFFFRLFWLLVFFRQFHFCHCSAVGVVVAVVVVSAAAAPSLQRPHCKLSRPPPNLLGWHTTRQRLCSVDVAVVVAVVVCCRFSFVVVIFVLWSAKTCRCLFCCFCCWAYIYNIFLLRLCSHIFVVLSLCLSYKHVLYYMLI